MTDLDKTIADWREHGTPGPWGPLPPNPQSSVDGMNDRSICSTGGYQDGTEKAFKENIVNAPFIAAAPAMADEIDRLNARIAELEGEVKEWKQGAEAEARAGDEARERVAELEAVVQKLWRRQDSLNTFDAAVNDVLAPLFERQTHLGASATTAIFDDLDSLYEGTER